MPLLPSLPRQITYSPTLRAHDLGKIGVGIPHTIPAINLTSSLALPPGLPSVDAWGLCSSSCLNGFVGGKARVLAAGIHMHVAGSEGDVTVSRQVAGWMLAGSADG